MLKIPKKVTDRISSNLKTYQNVASSHKSKDVSEADTVTLVKDILAYCFGFDKYQELTSEQQIRGTFCDLAVEIDSKIKYLIEVKAAGVNLNCTNSTYRTSCFISNDGNFVNCSQKQKLILNKLLIF